MKIRKLFLYGAMLIRAEGFIPRRLRRNKGDETRLQLPYENNIPRCLRRGMLILPLAMPLLAFVFPFFLYDEFSGIAYKGDKTIPADEIITFDTLTMRDMHISYMCADEETEYSKCYLIKNPRMKLDALRSALGSFCEQELEQNADGKKKFFLFYRTSRKMPWFWNESISSLDGDPSDLIGAFLYSEDNTLISCDVYKRSRSFFSYGKIKRTL